MNVFALPGAFLLGFALGGVWGFVRAFDALGRGHK